MSISMNSIKNIKRLKFYLWTGAAYLLVCFFFDLVSHPESFIFWAINEVWRSVYIVVIIYFLFERVVPALSIKRIFRSLLLLLLQFFLFTFGLFAWRYLGIGLHIYTSFAAGVSPSYLASRQFGDAVFAVFFFGVIRHVYNYRKLRSDAQKLRMEKQEAELNYLKSQTNPHFLFNTLNNIYSLARDKSDQAPESIMRLSKILRFMLYETGGEFIAIENELKIIDDYIALEKLRYDESLHINFNYNVEDLKQALPPLLLIPLVENAFKHGASETRNRPFVDIHLSVKDRKLKFYVKNSVDGSSDEKNVKENIGLSNLRRQLDLLYSDYSLSVRREDSVFTAALNINLASHV